MGATRRASSRDPTSPRPSVAGDTWNHRGGDLAWRSRAPFPAHRRSQPAARDRTSRGTAPCRLRHACRTDRGARSLEHWTENMPIFNVTPRSHVPRYRSGQDFAGRNPRNSPYGWWNWDNHRGPHVTPNVSADDLRAFTDTVIVVLVTANPGLGQFVPASPQSPWMESSEGGDPRRPDTETRVLILLSRRDGDDRTGRQWTMVDDFSGEVRELVIPLRRLPPAAICSCSRRRNVGTHMCSAGYTPGLDADPPSECVALFTVHGVVQSVFGYPNEEAYWHDPRGEIGQRVVEIVGSKWPNEIDSYNERTFGSAFPWAQPTRHFFGSKDVSAAFGD